MASFVIPTAACGSFSNSNEAHRFCQQMKYPLSAYLAPLFADDPIVMIDIGARWGMDARWAALGESVRAFC